MLESVRLQDFVKTQPRLKKLLNNKTFFTTEATSREISSLFCWVNNHFENYFSAAKQLEREVAKYTALAIEKQILQQKYDNLKAKLKELLKD
jgi:hypothetical protein